MKGWVTKRLGDLYETGSGGTPLRSTKDYFDGGTIPWVMSGEVGQGEVKETTHFITQKGLENSAARVFPSGTVLVAMYGATAGQVGILRIAAATNQAVCGILPNDDFVPDFIYRFLLSRKDELVAQAVGNAQPNISQIKIRNTIVPIVPLPEQRRIVSILDEAFEGIATAKANAEKNLQNDRALFESHLQSVFSQRGEGWVEKTISECFTIRSGDSLSATDMATDGTVDVYGGNGVTGKHDKWNITGENIVIGRVGARCGNVRSVRGNVWVTDNAFFIAKFLLPFDIGYLARLLTQSDLRTTAHQTAQPVISCTSIKQVILRFPASTRQQARINAGLDLIDAETQRLASIYERKLAALEALKKSLLDQAFSGKL